MKDKPTTIRITAKSKPRVKKAPWSNNAIQFPRLLAELEAAGAFTSGVMADLRDSMDLSTEDINGLMERANRSWERSKERLLSGI